MKNDTIDLRAAAQRVGVDASALRHAIHANRLNADLIQSPRGPYYMVTIEEIERFIRERQERRRRRRTESESAVSR